MKTALLLIAALAQDHAVDLLAKATEEFQRNQAKESNWSWVVEERGYVLDAAGKLIQQLPMVKVESVIRSDGRRCEAIASWSDDAPPYPEDADNDTRCQLVQVDFDLAGLALQRLLRNRTAAISEENGASITVTISPDKHPGNDSLAKCAAAMKGAVHLDRATLFPQEIQAEVVGSGCRVKSGHNTWFLVKGTTFDLKYALQKDRLGKTENDFWILTHKRVANLPELPGIYVVRNRKFAPNAPRVKQQLISESQTVAQEFGAQSRITFGGDPVKQP